MANCRHWFLLLLQARGSANHQLTILMQSGALGTPAHPVHDPYYSPPSQDVPDGRQISIPEGRYPIDLSPNMSQHQPSDGSLLLQSGRCDGSRTEVSFNARRTLVFDASLPHGGNGEVFEGQRSLPSTLAPPMTGFVPQSMPRLRCRPLPPELISPTWSPVAMPSNSTGQLGTLIVGQQVLPQIEPVAQYVTMSPNTEFVRTSSSSNGIMPLPTQFPPLNFSTASLQPNQDNSTVADDSSTSREVASTSIRLEASLV